MNAETRISATDFLRKRRAKNVAIGLAIFGLNVLFFVITLVRMGGH